MDEQPQQHPGFPPGPPPHQPASPYGQPHHGQPQAPNHASPYGPPQAPYPGHNPYAQGPAAHAHNPYAAPVSDGAPSWQMGMDEHGILASRGARFGGSLLDSMIYMVVALPILFLTVDLDSMATDPDTFAIYAKIGIPVLLVACVQWYLVATTGQSLAKKMLGMKIVKTTGEDVNFVSGVILRSWIPAVIGWLPLVGGFFGLADALFIFGEEHQCLHDKIASTKVISV